MLTIVFDATILTNYIYKSAARSGIFFVALNVLKELSYRKDVHVVLYFSPEKTFEGIACKNEFFPCLELVQDISHHKHLAKLNKKSWEIYNSKRKNIVVKVAAAFAIVFTRKIAKRLAKKHLSRNVLQNADFYFSPAYKIPDEIRSYPLKKALVLHDPSPYIFPNFFKSKRSSFLDVIKSSSNENDFFFCVSQSSLNDFKKYFSFLNSSNSAVTHLAANGNFKNVADGLKISQIRNKYGIPEQKKFVFSLCTIEPRKNIVRAVKTFIEFIEKNRVQDLVWVMGGGHWDSFAAELQRSNVKWNPEQICRIGYVDDEDLSVLYSSAEWFVYTSQYEGFGLPPLEAMQCGCPVIVSNNSSLPEVVGDAGIMIDWDSDEQHVAAYEKYYFDENIRNEYAQKGLERAKNFSWEKTVDTILKKMSEVSGVV